MMKGKIKAICLSEVRGVVKKDRGYGVLKVGFGLEGDAHGGNWHRQVSLLGEESIAKMKDMGLPDLAYGDFAENITTEGIDLPALPIGTKLKIGKALLEVTQIGKKCHHDCEIFKKIGQCVMPKEGIFAVVLEGGEIRAEDVIEVLPLFKIGIITASDKGSQGEREDESGQAIRELLERLPGTIGAYKIVPDEQKLIEQEIIRQVDEERVDVLFTTGGTGLGPRDVTPDATLAVIDRVVPGIAEAMRMESLKKTNRAMLSRAVAGTRGKALIINLPGSKKAVCECLEVILPVIGHALEILQGRGGECGR